MNDKPENLCPQCGEMWDLIEQFGGAVTDMFEQLERGNWKDSEGHDVRLNARMIDLKKPVIDAIALRAALWSREMKEEQ